jgi:hypothetical protein
MFMGAFIVRALAFVKSFLWLFRPLPETAGYHPLRKATADFTDATPAGAVCKRPNLLT